MTLTMTELRAAGPCVEGEDPRRRGDRSVDGAAKNDAAAHMYAKVAAEINTTMNVPRTGIVGIGAVCHQSEREVITWYSIIYNYMK
jgi:hypothetical protein